MQWKYILATPDAGYGYGDINISAITLGLLKGYIAKQSDRLMLSKLCKRTILLCSTDCMVGEV